MKSGKVLQSLLLGVALLLATNLFAANKGSVHLYDPVTLNGKQLAPGDYTVTWDGNGPSVELKLSKGKDVVATAPAQLTNFDQPANTSSVTTRNNGAGSPALSEIRLGGKKYIFSITEPAQTAADSSK